MSSLKGFVVITIVTALVAMGALELNIGEHHRDPLWALGSALGFIVLVIVDVWLFFAVAKDDPFKWE